MFNNMLSDGPLQNVNASIASLINRRNSLKSNVKNVVEDQSSQFRSVFKDNKILKSKAEELLKEMSLIEDDLDENLKLELSNCSGDLNILSCSLKEINLFIGILKELLEIHTIVSEAKNKIDKKLVKAFYPIGNLIGNNKRKLIHRHWKRCCRKTTAEEAEEEDESFK